MSSNIEQLANEVGQLLKKYNYKLATAESCTGGGLSYFITNISGSSAWFERGFVTYSNTAKIEMLGVKENTLSQFGAVSNETAREMAEGALRKSETHISAAITGIAGPLGGAAEKPVGTVWIALAGIERNTEANKFIFSGDRQSIREQAILKTLEEIKIFVLHKK